MASLRKKINEFLSGYFGGPQFYNNANIKPAHYHMNITDFHVDAVLEIYQAAFSELGIHCDAVRDALTMLGKIRQDVTTGCTVRREMSKKSTQKGKGALFNKLGGDEGIAMAMDRFYELLAVDNRIKKVFQKKDISKLKSGQRTYITELVGGSKVYKGRELDEVHKNLGIDDYHFDCFLMDFEKALSGLGIDDESIDEVLVVLEGVRQVVLNREKGMKMEHKLVEKKTILERLGGELNLEAVVDTMYCGAVGDPRIKYFFLKDEKKLPMIKSKMVSLLTGLLGGTVTYDFSQLKVMHYNMNITDYHFDAVVENLQCACELMEVDPAVITDIIQVVTKVRYQITAGCTVRLEVARKKTETLGTDGLFTQIGGNEGMKKFIDVLYNIILEDGRISRFISGSKVEAIKAAQERYLAQLFGSSIEYTGRSLERVHAMVQIQDFHFDSYLDDAVTALKAIGVEADSLDECIVLMETVRHQVVQEDARKHNVRNAQKMANKKKLYDRIGAESTIAKLVDISYNTALEDDRIRSFFEKNKAKIQTIKNKMTQLICGLTGGPSTYDMKNLRHVHYSMNILDYHFDAMLDIFNSTLLWDLKIKPEDAKETIQALQSIRVDVTIGCTVRTELARKSISRGRDILFQRVGKSEGVENLINAVFDIIEHDSRINSIINETNRKAIKQGQLLYITELLGGPKTYSGKDIPSIHFNLGITDYHFDAFLTDVQKAMVGMGMKDDVLDGVLITLEGVRAEILNRSRSIAEASQKEKNGELLITRLGGDMNLETIVECMYDKALADTRVKFHFHKSKHKQRQIRMKMYQYLSSAFGGPIQYDISNLRPAHYNMNIGDFHFDAVVEMFQMACKENDVDAETVDDAVAIVNKIRPDIVTGCTVRLELARKKNAEEGPDQLFARLGGLEGTDALVARLYECVEADRRINIFFEGSKLKFIKRAQTAYLIMTLGGPLKYSGRSLEDIHETLAMNDYHVDCFLQCMQTALWDCGHDQETVDEVTVVLEMLRKKILHHYYKSKGYVVR